MYEPNLKSGSLWKLYGIDENMLKTRPYLALKQFCILVLHKLHVKMETLH